MSPGSLLKRIFIVSPLRGDYARNLALAKFLCKIAVQDGFAPFAPHIFYTQFLDDGAAPERMQGIDAGLAWLRVAQEVWAYADNFEACSAGMKAEIRLAELIGVPVLYMPPTLSKAQHIWQRGGA